MNDEERSPARWALFGLVALTFPVAWPIVELVRAVRLRRFDAAWSRRGRDVDAAMATLRARRAVAARLLVCSFSTIASGPDEDELYDVTLEDGARVVIEARTAPRAEVDALLAHVAVRVATVHRWGIALPFLWAAWLASVVVLALVANALGAA